MRPEPPDHRKRCKRWDAEGDAHFLTFSCYQRQPFLTSARACGWFLEALDSAREKEPFDLWGFVFMPDHVHLLLLPHRESRIGRILTALKVPVTRRANAWVRRHAPEFLTRMADRHGNGEVAYRFWQRGGGYDRNLRSVRDIHEKFVYMHWNPVRRGLVARPEDWPWSSYTAWANGVDKPIRIDRESFPPLISF